MSGEVWQFLVIGVVAVIIAVLWLFIIYLPRWTAEGEGDQTAKSSAITSPKGEAEEHD